MKKISVERLAELLKAEYKLSLLEGAGVDNWEAYGYALCCKWDDDMESYHDYKKKSDKELTEEFDDVE